MPTPSAPDPQTQYAFTSTCPDPDERHDDTHVTNNDHTSQQHDDLSNPIAIPPHFSPNDGPVSDNDAMSSPLSDAIRSSGAAYDHKPTEDVELDRSQSPYSSSPIESIQTSRPRQGVGTTSASHLSIEESAAYQDPGSEYAMEEDYGLPSMGYGISNRRIIPNSPSSFLRAGSRFTGTQQSERQVYEVQVEIKYVDLRESFLCGYLRIQGLTDDHPTLTTYFEGEIISGHKHTFTTRHADWGATLATDLSHWAKFPAFRPYAKQARRASGSSHVAMKDVAQSEHIFMRWKEHFLVPDHRVRTITGASFEGFYYICFNQVQGTVSGIYFHSKSERFQQLELKHVEDRGCYSALEFR